MRALFEQAGRGQWRGDQFWLHEATHQPGQPVQDVLLVVDEQHAGKVIRHLGSPRRARGR